MKTYKIVSGISALDLEKEVNKFLKKGFEITGNISVYYDTFYQPMILKEKDSENKDKKKRVKK